MRFVKTVTGKFFHQVKNTDCQFRINTLFFSALFKNRTLLGHLLGFFLTHCPPQHVRTAEGITGEHLGDLHHLFLIHNHAISRLKHGLKARVLKFSIGISHLRATVFPVDKVIHHARFERTRTKQCHQRDQVFDVIRLQALDQILHPARFKLEYRRGFRPLQQRESAGIIEWNSSDIERRFTALGTVLVDHQARPVDDGQGAQAEEVKLHQTRFFDVVFVELGNQAAAGFVAIQRGEIRQSGRRNNHATRVLADVARESFKLPGHVPDFLTIAIVLKEFAQYRFLLQSNFKRHSGRRGNHF